MKSQQKETCQVCFVNPHRLFDYSQIIRCVTCGQTCHRSCYLPSSQQNDFKCDKCQFSTKRNEICFICGNQGLLKKVEDQYAHPLCLLFSPKAIVLEYSTLTFALIRTSQKEKHPKKAKCSICKKPGELQKCYAECSNEVHMFCAWKSYQQDNGWNHNTIVQNLEYSFYFQKKSKLYLQHIGQTLKTLIDPFSSKVSRKKLRQFQLACPDHTDTIFQCCVQQKYFNQTQIDYIQCDQCFRWYHKDCLDTKIQSNKQQIFICSNCHSFWKILNLNTIHQSNSKHQLFLKRFPRLNICELIHLQFLFERKAYNLTKLETKFLFSIPIQPSLIFLENHIKKNINLRLKVQHFKSLCRLNLKQRIDKKQFKDKFEKKYEPILALITQTKTLYDLREEYEKSKEIKSQKYVQDEERQRLMEWISMLDKLRNKNNLFNEVISKLIKNLKNWLRSISKQEEDSVKSFEDESINSSIEDSQSVKVQKVQKIQKVQATHAGEVKVKQMSSQEESSIQGTGSELTQSKNQSSSKSYLPNSQQSSKRVNIKDKNIIVQQQKENLSESNENLQNKILSAIKVIRKNCLNKRTNKQDLALKLLNHHNDKLFFIQTVFDEKLPQQSALKALLLQVTLKSINNLIEQHKIKDKNLNLNRHYDLATCSEQTYDRSRIQSKNSTQTKVLFVQKFRDKIVEIYYSSDIQIKKKFKQRIQSLFKSSDDFIDTLNLQKSDDNSKKLTLEEAFNKLINNPNSKGFSQSLRAQIKSSFDQNELNLLRLQIQKKKTYVKLKNVEFTRQNSSKISNEYENHCKSSSEENQSSSTENKINLPLTRRQQTLALQKKALQQWIKMFSFTFNLANQFLALRSNNEDQFKLGNKNSFYDKEPLVIIEQFISINYADKTQLKKKVFKLILAFFCKIKQSLINYKSFHQTFVKIIEKIANVGIQFSVDSVLWWTQDQQSLSTIRYLYKTYHTNFFVDNKKKETQRFKKIWEIFQTDELYSEYLQENMSFIFRDPQLTEQILKEKIPQMLIFYQQNEIICRFKQLKRIRIWISYYFRCLFFIGPQHLVEEQFITQRVKQKYQQDKKLSFNQLAIIISDMHKLKFPQCSFTKKIINIFNKATLIENEIQSFFNKSAICLEQSYMLRQDFQNTYNFGKGVANLKDRYVEIKKNRIFSSEFKSFINLIQNNEVSQIITYDLEKYTIFDQRNGFKRIVMKTEQIIKTNDQLIPVKELNFIYFQILSYPFRYVNLNIFLTFIIKRVEIQHIYGDIQVKKQNKQQEFLATFLKAFGEILTELESQSKMMCRTLTRQKIIIKIQQISQQQAFKYVQKNAQIQKSIQLINQKIQRFDKIKSSLSKLSQKINLNQTLEHQEVQELDSLISAYKSQKICQFTFQMLSTSLEQYKLAFSAIPDDPMDKLTTLKHIKSLEKPFKTKELLKRICQLQKVLGEY